MIALRAYRTLLRLYPEDYTGMFAEEMVRAFERIVNEQCGPRFLLRELMGLTIGAAGEWAAKLTTDKSLRGRTLPDVRMMRPVGVPQAVWFAGRSRSVR